MSQLIQNEFVLTRKLRGVRARLFTLTEAVAASVVAGIVLASGMGVLSFYLWNDKMLDDRLSAMSIAQNRIGYLRSIAYDDLALTGEAATKVNSSGVPSADGAFLRSTTVTAGDASNTYSAISVSVQISGRLGRPSQTVQMQTIMMNRSLINNME